MNNPGTFAIGRPLSIWLFAVILFAAGVVAYFELPRLEDPEFSIKSVRITTEYPGASPKETATEVSSRIEDAVQQLGQLKELETRSSFGLSVVTAEMKDRYRRSELPQIWDELRNKTGDVKLPPGCGTPVVMDDYGDVYGSFYALTGKGYSHLELHEFAKFLQKRLVNGPDVRRIEFWGVRKRAVYIRFQMEKTARLGISPEIIRNLLKEKNLIRDEGWVRAGSEYLPVNMVPSVQIPEDLLNTVITRQSGKLITLRDIATVEYSYVDPPKNLMYFNGEPAIGIGISTVSGGNVVKMGNAVTERLNSLAGTFPAGMKLTPVSLQSETVEKAVSSFTKNLLESVGIVVLVLMLFMGLKSGFVIGFVLFLTVCGTLAVMNWIKMPLERISLGALIISLGMLVDNAIVIVEGMSVRMRKGETALSAAGHVVGQCQFPLLGATAVAVLAFGAIGLSDDSTGEFCSSLFYVLLISLVLSWVLAVTVVPVLCHLFFRTENSVEIYRGAGFRFFRQAVDNFVRNKYAALIFFGTVLCLGFTLFPMVGKNFFPASTRPQFLIDVWLPYGTAIQETDAVSAGIAEYVKTLPGIGSTSRYVGGGTLRFILTYSPEQNDSGYALILADVSDYRKIDELTAQIRKHCSEHFPGVSVEPYKFVLGPGAKGKIQARFSGPDETVLRSLEERCSALMRADPDACSVGSDWRNRIKVLRPVISEYRTRRAGITDFEISNAIQESFEGLRIGIFRDGEEQAPIFARSESYMNTPEHLSSIPIWSPVAEKSIPLRQFINRMETLWLDPVLVTRDRVPAVTVHCDPVSGLASTLWKKLKPSIEAIPRPPGYSLSWDGEYEDSRNAESKLISKIPLFLILMVSIVILMFNSLRKALIVWLCVPLAVSGVALGLLVWREPFGFMALLGFLSLSGMLIKNAVVLVDEISLRAARGEPDAVTEGAVSRVRPVLLAAFTTVFGMVPLLWDAFFSAMATAVMGGLAFGSLLTLLAVPVFYAILYPESAKS